MLTTKRGSSTVMSHPAESELVDILVLRAGSHCQNPCGKKQNMSRRLLSGGIKQTYTIWCVNDWVYSASNGNISWVSEEDNSVTHLRSSEGSGDEPYLFKQCATLGEWA